MRKLFNRKVFAVVGGIVVLAVVLGLLAQAGGGSNRSGFGAVLGAEVPQLHESTGPAAGVAAPRPLGAPEGMPAPSAAPGRSAQAPAAKPAGGAVAQAPSDTASAQPWDRMIIRNATLSLQVDNVESAMERIRQITDANGGFISASNIRTERVDDDERPVANLTLQVPARQFDATVQELRKIAAKVELQNGTSQDVTEEYVDLDSNLRNLRASEMAIIKLMDRAQRIEDVLALQRELTNLRGQIERIEGRKRFLERRSELATINVSLHLPPLESGRTQPRGKGWNPLESARRGWEASLAILRYVADGVILALAFSWWLLPFVLAGAYFWNARRSRRATPTPAATDV